MLDKKQEHELEMLNLNFSRPDHPVYTEYVGAKTPHCEIKSIHSYYMVLNACHDLDIGCYFSGTPAFNIHRMSRGISCVSATKGRLSYNITVKREYICYFNKNLREPSVSHTKNTVRFINLNHEREIIEFCIESGYGEIIEVVSSVNDRCGVAWVKYQNDTIYLFAAARQKLDFERPHKACTALINKFKEENMALVLKTMLFTSWKFKKYGLDAGFRCYFNKPSSELATLYFVNTSGIKSFTTLTLKCDTYDGFSRQPPFNIDLKRGDGFSIVFKEKGEEIIIEESISEGAIREGLSGKPSKRVREDIKAMHVTSPLLFGSHDIKVSFTNHIISLLENVSVHGYTSHITAPLMKQSITLKFMAPYPV